MNHSGFSRFLFAADLFICGIWLMLVLHVGSTSHYFLSYSLLWTVPLFRIWLSFLTHRRSRLALMPLLFLVALLLSTLQRHGNPVFLLLNRPGLVLIKSAAAMFCPGALSLDEFSDMWYGSWDCRYLILALASVWLVIIPTAVYLYRLVRKQLVPSQFGGWRGVGLCAYVLCALVVMSAFVGELGLTCIPLLVLIVLLMLIPAVFNHGKIGGLLTRVEQAFVIGLALLGVSYMSALSFGPLSIVMTLVMPAAIYALVNWCMDRKLEYADVLMLVAGSVLFCMGQYLMDMLRVVLLLLSLGLYSVPIIRFAYSTKMYRRSIALYLTVALAVPVLCAGYNPYAVMDAGRCAHYDEYSYSRNGLLLVRSADGLGIRDRYGLVLAAEYERVDHLEPSKPYCKVLKDGLWMIYDIERHKFLSEEKYAEVLPCGKGEYKLVLPDGSEKSMVMPFMYSRYSYGQEAEIR